MKRKRRKFTGAFESKVALEALREDKPISAVGARHGGHPNQVSSWKRKAVERMQETFSGGWSPGSSPPVPPRRAGSRRSDGGRWPCGLCGRAVC